MIGYVRELDDQEADKFLAAMASALEPEQDVYRTELYHDHHAGIGRVTLGILNPENQHTKGRFTLK